MSLSIPNSSAATSTFAKPFTGFGNRAPTTNSSSSESASTSFGTAVSPSSINDPDTNEQSDAPVQGTSTLDATSLGLDQDVSSAKSAQSVTQPTGIATLSQPNGATGQFLNLLV